MASEEQSVPEVDATEDQARPPRRSAGSRLLGFLTEGTLIIVGALIISTLLRTFLAQMFVIPSESMQHTIEKHDRVVVSKIGGIERGDVVVFEDAYGWLNEPAVEKGPVRAALEFVGVLPNSSVDHLIKRVIGMPGDHIKCCSPSGKLEINGVELDESSYLFTQDGIQIAPSSVPFEVVVPAGHIFVMGDHRNASADSRCHLNDISELGDGQTAFIPIENVVGPALAIVSPLDRLDKFSVPDGFAAIPAATAPAPEKAEIIEASPSC